MSDHLPIDEVAEKGLLSSMLRDSDIYLENAGTTIHDRLFEFPANRVIYFAIEDLAHSFKGEIPWTAFLGQLQSRLEEIGGKEYLNHVYGFSDTGDAWSWFHKRAVAAYKFRRARGSARAILELGLDDLDLAVERAQLALQDIVELNDRPLVSFKERLSETLEWIEQQALNQPRSVVRFGIPELDDALLPVEAGDQIVICADTSRGKTALSAQAVLNTFEPFAIFSLEMQARSLVVRMLASESNVSFSDLRKGRLKDRDYPLLTNAVTRLAERTVWIEDQHPITAAGIAAKCRMLKRKSLCAIVVDYLQLVSGGATTSNSTREREVADVSRTLKSLALELGIVVIALSQLNDAGHLRESRAIGQDADIVLAIVEDEGKTFIQVRKNRNGPRSLIPVVFDGARMRFSGGSGKTTANSGSPRLPYKEEAQT